jgi:very-short-patch-repair endonuclease
MAKKKPSQKATLEDQFLDTWKRLWPYLPQPCRQYPIKNPETGRDWRLDFSWAPEMLCVEIQGGSFVAKGRHNHPIGQARDYIKHNHLTSQGWRVLYFNTPLLKNMEDAVNIVAEVLCNAREVP